MLLKAVLAVDIGTGSTRAGLIDESLSVRSLGVCTYRLYTPHPGWAEQDPAEILDAVEEAIGKCLADAGSDVSIRGICLDTALHSLIALDKADAPLTNLWTWADMRAAGSLGYLSADREQALDLYVRTGCPVHAMYFPAKISWFREHQPDLFLKTATFTSVKGYVLHHLTGAKVEDLSIASGTGLLGIDTLDWDARALDITGIDRRRLWKLAEPDSVAGELKADLARRWQIDPMPVVIGGSDGPLANVGAGCVNQGDMVITVGTSSAVRMISASPLVDQDARTWCYYLSESAWVVGGAINGGGTTLDWFRQAFPDIKPARGESIHARLERMALDVSPGSDGLIFAPYLAGERNPGWQAEARGYMAGLGLHHTASHFVRAIMEGIAYQIAWVYQSVAEVAGDPNKIRITGGFIDSLIWPQILADVLGRTLEVPTNKEGSLIGCAALGFSALDPALDWRSLVQDIPVQTRIEPNMSNHRRYAEILKTYKHLYQAVAPHFHEIAALQE